MPEVKDLLPHVSPSRNLSVAARLVTRAGSLRDLFIQPRWPACEAQAHLLKSLLPTLRGLRRARAAFILHAWQLVQTIKGYPR